METFAYLNHACASEAPDGDFSFTLASTWTLNGLKWHRLSGAAWTKFLSLAVSLLILSAANAAMALLQQGDRGDEVSNLQNLLKSAGCYNGSISGFFGPQTREGVLECQRKFGLEQDGVAGPVTMAALQGGSTPIAPQSTPTEGFRSASINSPLRRGDRGAEVEELQRRLQGLRYNPGPIDGIFGGQTEAALLQFQRDRGLTVDGRVGAEVRTALGLGESAPIDQFAPAPTTRRLTIGDSGPEVEALQRRLRELKYFTGSAPTGYFGPITKDAVTRFQQARRLPATGIADERTLAALNISPVANQARYLVVIPRQDANTLAQVRRFVRNAFEAKSRLGDYVNAGAFPTYEAANQRSQSLRSQGLDARVAYRDTLLSGTR